MPPRIPKPPHPYLPNLTRAQRAAYAITSGTPDLTDEIRLLRVLLGTHLTDPHATLPTLLPLLTTLIRACHIQSTRAAPPNDLERAIHDAAERILDLETP